MSSPRTPLVELIEEGAIPADKVEAVLIATEVLPGGRSWLKFVDQLLLWLGSLAIALAALFFIAYNWAELGRFGKFAMVEALMVLAVAAYWRLDPQQLAAKATLLVATIFLGVLLALYGQTYQTGADPWQLFFNWVLLMLPWVIIGRFAAIWVVWLTLLNLSCVLYYMTFHGLFGFIFDSDVGMLWLLFLLNGVALLAWEWLSGRWLWLAERWAVRLLAFGSGAAITGLAIYAVVDFRGARGIELLVWLAWLVVIYHVYRNLRHDLFMLAGMALSVIVVVMSFLARHLLDDFEAAGFLFIALALIGMGTGAAVWLRGIHREWQS